MKEAKEDEEMEKRDGVCVSSLPYHNINKKNEIVPQKGENVKLRHNVTHACTTYCADYHKDVTIEGGAQAFRISVETSYHVAAIIHLYTGSQ